MNCFFSDIDNTLIFSHRKTCSKDRLAAEYLNGREQSYITKTLFAQLKKIALSYNVVSVTARTVDQYKRLELLRREVLSEYALVCNGGILLRNNIIDTVWREETLRLTSRENNEVQKLRSAAEREIHDCRIVNVDEFLFYLATDDVDAAFGKITALSDLTKVNVEKDQRKVYVISRSANKGTAVQRFMSLFGVKKSIVVGDSILDIPMLKLGDINIASKGLHPVLGGLSAVYSKNDLLAAELDEILIHITGDEP